VCNAGRICFLSQIIGGCLGGCVVLFGVVCSCSCLSCVALLLITFFSNRVNIVSAGVRDCGYILSCVLVDLLGLCV